MKNDYWLVKLGNEYLGWCEPEEGNHPIWTTRENASRLSFGEAKDECEGFYGACMEKA